MTEWLKITDYHFDRPKLVVLVSPHGSDGKNFFRAFNDLYRHAAIAERSELWRDYLRIEQDYGANQLAKVLAEKICHESSQIGCRVIEFDYPRGLIDGGRTLNHCLRQSLPANLLDHHRQSFLTIHQQSLDLIQRFYRELAQRPHLLIDVHTMASYCPHNVHGHPETIPVSWQNLESYVKQFTLANQMGSEIRKIDLISASPQGEIIGDKQLLQNLVMQLQRRSLPFAENHPYPAAKEFLMYHHMRSTQGIAIDIPKHLLAEQEEIDFRLESFDLDQKKLVALAEFITDALFQRWNLQTKQIIEDE